MDKFIVTNDGGRYAVVEHPNGCSYAYALHVAWSFNKAQDQGKRFARIELDQLPQETSPASPPNGGGNRVPLSPVPPAPPSLDSLVAPSGGRGGPIHAMTEEGDGAWGPVRRAYAQMDNRRHDSRAPEPRQASSADIPF